MIASPEVEPDRPSPTGVAPAASASPQPITIIQPASGWQWLNLRELWTHRELLYFFTWRDVKVRYKQTAIGAAWAILQPTFMMIIFSLVLGRLDTAESLAVPYPIFVFAALLPWNLFATALGAATMPSMSATYSMAGRESHPSCSCARHRSGMMALA